MDYPQGPDPYVARQYVLHHMYSPLISLDASYNADLAIQSAVGSSDESTLLIMRPYGNNAKYSLPNQIFKITNGQLITKNYPSFPIRFEPALPDLLSIKTGTRGNKLSQLFSISSLEALMKQVQSKPNNKSHRDNVEVLTHDMYLYFFNKIITSNNIVPFESFNHPISQIFVINFHTDTLDTLRNMIVEFRNFNFPKYFQLDDLLVHAFVLYDSNESNANDLLEFHNQAKKSLSVSCTFIDIAESDEPPVNILNNENSTIDEDLQRISLQQSSNKADDIPTSDKGYFHIPSGLDKQLRTCVYQFITNNLIPHMEKKIRQWDDQILSPKKSIAGRLFSVSRKFFNSNDHLNATTPNTSTNNSSSTHFNYNENYYYKSSPEQAIRKLADWSIMLKDFKYAYSTYDLIKKDYSNDKAWVYVASCQEMCIVSLLLVQTQQIAANSNSLDRNTLRKIRHDIIEPYLDNLSYTYKSRLNLKTYSIRTVLIVIELLLCMCGSVSISWWWNDLIEKYLSKCVYEFDNHLVAANQSLQVIKALLYERLGYVFGRYSKARHEIKVISGHEVPEDGYINEQKINTVKPLNSYGLTRFRKSSLWYLMAMSQWLELKNYGRIDELLQNVGETFTIDTITDNWYDRSDLLLGFIKRVELSEGDKINSGNIQEAT